MKKNILFWLISFSILNCLLAGCGPKHKYIKEIIPATCEEEGFTLYLCEDCGDYYEDDIIKPLGHDLEHHIEKASTCEEEGYTAYAQCKRCAYTTFQSNPALGHSYGNPSYTWSEDKTKVTGTLICENDSSHRIDEIAITVKELQQPSCEESGSVTYIAEFTNSLFTTQKITEDIKPMQHDIQYVEAKEATCTEAGYQAFEYCTRCEYTTKQEIPALNHSYDTNEICRRCGALEAWEYLSYEYDSSSRGYIITGVRQERVHIHIPKMYQNQPVKGIGEGAFKNQSLIQAIQIPETILSIGSKAFQNCTNLRELIIPNSVESISDYILEGCSSLISLSMPNIRNKNLGTLFSMSGFNNSYKTANGYLPYSLKNVTLYGGKIVYTFSGCSYIEKIVLNQVTQIDRVFPNDSPFQGCSNLKELHFDACLESIGNESSGLDCLGLSSCNNLEKIYYKGTVNDWAKIKIMGLRQKTSPAQYANEIYFVDEVDEARLVTELNITDPSIKEIGVAQFLGFKDVRSISLPSTITTIGSSAFMNCSSLASIVIPEGVNKISSSTFEGCYNVQQIEISASTLNAYYNTAVISLLFGNNEYEKSYRVGPTAAYGYAPLGLEKIIIHGDAELSSYEFKNMTSLKEIDLSDCSNIPSYCFANCTNLETVLLNENVNIRGNAFRDTTALKQVFYRGTKENWMSISMGSENGTLTENILYFYSEEAPIEVGKYWHYVDDTITKW